MSAHLLHADCRAVLAALPDASVDAIVTDPPYELGFMGKRWDGSGIAYSVDLWADCLRVLKPGGHLAAFGGARTYHRMTCAIEDAGFEIRDGLQWLYGSGFPKSLNVGAGIMKLHGLSPSEDKWPAETEAWRGYGTALKPAAEPIVLARKPLGGTVAANVLAHGTGALNIDGCRVEHASAADLATSQSKNPGRLDVVTSEVYGAGRPQQSVNAAGRWPSNVLLSHAEQCGEVCADGCPVAELDAQSGMLKSGTHAAHHRRTAAGGNGNTHGAMAGVTGRSHDDSGGASRFFPTFRYQAKAPSKERPKVDGVAHPTVKPLDLMRWLVRLVTPPGGLVLDPFAGSGTTLQAARDEGFRALGVEQERDYYRLACQRLGFDDAGAVAS